MGSIVVRVVGARLWRQAFEELITKTSGVQAAAENASWAASQVTVLLGLEGQGVQDHLRHHPAARCVLVTNENEMRDAALHHLGLSVFVGQGDDAATLHDAIRQALSGRAFCSPTLLPALISAARHGDDSHQAIPALALLSAREHEVVGYALEGLANDEIAAHLHVSLSTVKYHLFNAYRKLGVSRRAQLRGALTRQHELSHVQAKPKL